MTRSGIGRPAGFRLLADAQRAGVTLNRTPDGLGITVDGPPAAGPLVAALRLRKPLLRHVFYVYTGLAPLLDWGNEHRATVTGQAHHCYLCGQATHLLDPFDQQPCHKVCAEAAIAPIPAALASLHRLPARPTAGPPRGR